MATLRARRRADGGSDRESSSEEADGRPTRPHSILPRRRRRVPRDPASRDLTLLVGLYCAQTVVAGASLVFGVAIALDLLDLDEASVGLLDAMLGVGGLVGGFLALVLATRGRLAVDFGFGVLLWSAPLLLVVAWPSLGPVLLDDGPPRPRATRWSTSTRSRSCSASCPTR